MKREPLSRGEKVLGGASLAVVTVLVGGMMWMQSIEEEPAVAYPPVAPLPVPNGFDVYLAARQSISAAIPSVDPASDNQTITDPKVRAERYGLKRREAWLQTNARGFALFKNAMALPCRHPSARSGTGKAFLAYRGFREMARFKTAEANTRKLRGDWNGAMQSGLDTIQMGIDVPRGGALIGKMVGTACAAIGKASVEDVPDHLSANEARTALARLEALLARRVSYADAMKEDKWVSISEFLKSTRTTNWRQLDPTEDFTLHKWIRKRTVSKKTLVRGLERSADEALLDLQKPYSAAHTFTPPDESDPLSGWTGGLGSMMRFSEAREKTGQELLLLRLALRAFTLDHGSPPSALKQLVPGYLKALPTDVFADGAPLHYRVQGKNYTLWSVGPDKKNDGGKPIPPRGAPTPGVPRNLPSVMEESLGDWVAGKNR